MQKPSTGTPRVNYAISSPKVEVINQNDEMIGILHTKDAIKLAQQAGLDLVEVFSDTTPPICKIVDYCNYMSCKECSS